MSRILVISSEFPPGPGGIGAHAYQLAGYLHIIGHRIQMLAPQDYAGEEEIRLFNDQLPYNFTRLHHPSPKFLEGLVRLWKVFSSLILFDPHIVIASGMRQVWLAALLHFLKPGPLMAIGHGSEFAIGSGLEQRLTRWAFNQANGIVCVSQHTRAVMHRLCIFPKSEIVITNGADASMFGFDFDSRNRSVLSKWGLKEDSFVLLTVGNVSKRKGQDLVIRAMPEILLRSPNVHYLIAGLPTLKKEYSELASDLGVQEHVHFLGILDQDLLVKTYQACDLFIMTSRHDSSGDFEGYGIAVIEAALCGKPAVVSKGSGLEEAVVDGLTGICVPENDPHSVAKAVCQLMGNQPLREALGKNALERALNEQTWEVVGSKYDAFIKSLIKE